MSEKTNLTVHEGEKLYTLRKLANKDTWTGARIVSKVISDPRLPIMAAQIAGNPNLGEGERNTALMFAFAGSLMEHAPQDFENFLRDVAGLSEEEWDGLPPEATFDILSELVERDDFLPIARSVSKLSEVARKAFSSWRSQHSGPSNGQTTNS